MPVFHFDTTNGIAHPDIEGIVLPDIAAARAEALRFAGEVMRDNATFWTNTGWTLTVTDQAGLTLFMISIACFDAPAIDRRAH